MLTLLRYLHHNDTSGATEMVINVWFEANPACQISVNDPLLYASLLNIAGLTDLAIGEFFRAEKRLLECKSIRSTYLAENDEPMVNINSNIGLAYGCQQNYQKGIHHLQEALRITQTWSHQNLLKEVLVYTNMGKVHGVAGNFSAGESCLHIALQAATTLDSLFWITA